MQSATTTDKKAVTEWGSKARKDQAKPGRGIRKAKAITEAIG